VGSRAGKELWVAGFLLRTSERVEEPVRDALREVLGWRHKPGATPAKDTDNSGREARVARLLSEHDTVAPPKL
jgi:hypothetical protein